MVPIRQYIVRWLQTLRLLGGADRVAFGIRVLRARSVNRAFRQTHPGHPLPPLALLYETCHHVRFDLYVESGEDQAGRFRELIEQHRPLEAIQRVGEWGCGTGRLLEPLRRFWPERVALAGTDLDPRCIDWCRNHLPGIDFQVNGLTPPLPFPDAHFDALIARSVLTHLSGPQQEAWLRELFRVLKPGGLLLFTTMGTAYRNQLIPAERARFDAGQLVVRSEAHEGSKSFSAFHPPADVRVRLVPGRPILVWQPPPWCRGLHQDLWLVRNDFITPPFQGTHHA